MRSDERIESAVYWCILFPRLFSPFSFPSNSSLIRDLRREIDLHDSSQKCRNHSTQSRDDSNQVYACKNNVTHCDTRDIQRLRSVTIRSYLLTGDLSRVPIPSLYLSHFSPCCTVEVGFIRCVESSQISREYCTCVTKQG